MAIQPQGEFHTLINNAYLISRSGNMMDYTRITEQVDYFLFLKNKRPPASRLFLQPT
jgi:hypothetical protein